MGARSGSSRSGAMSTEKRRTAAPDLALWMARSARDHLIRSYGLSEIKALRLLRRSLGLLEAEAPQSPLRATIREMAKDE